MGLRRAAVGYLRGQLHLDPTGDQNARHRRRLVFGIALLLDLLDTNLGARTSSTAHTMMLIGFLLLSLYLAGVGTGRGAGGGNGGRWYRGRRPGRG